jgi:4-diphosphocytidyl-2-C-methyl-D-erythritol kinase
MNDALHETAPAKLNLCLYVGAKRADGLHEICSLFCPLTLTDELTLTEAEGAADEVVCPAVKGPNLVAAALSAFRERFGWDGRPVRIEIEKRIPVAAGLGGGSADAAAALRLAVRASRIEPPREQLYELAASLGADVPSQLEPRLQLVSGAGEQLQPFEQQLELNAVLLVCRDGLSTADVYAHADSMFPPRSNLTELAERVAAAVIGADGNALALGELLHNDLQGSSVAIEPSAGEALDRLRESGARAALTTGSGPTVFGLFADAQSAQRAATEIDAQWDGAALATGAAIGPSHRGG